MATYAGIDIAKHGFDLAFEPKQKVPHFDNDAKGIQRCCKLLKQCEPELIVMEPTGGYEVALVIKQSIQTILKTLEKQMKKVQR